MNDQSNQLEKEANCPEKSNSNASSIIDSGKIQNETILKKIGNKTKLTVVNGVLDFSSMLNSLKIFTVLMSSKSEIKKDINWNIKVTVVCLLFFLQFFIFGCISSIAIIKEKKNREKVNNLVLFLSPFVVLFEVVKNMIPIQN